MIVLQRIDLHQGTAEFAAFSGEKTGIDAEFKRILERAREVCLYDIHLRYPDGSVKHHRLPSPMQLLEEDDNTSESASEAVATQSTTTLSTSHTMKHLWTLEGGSPTYDVRIKHAPESLSQLATYLTLVLTTFGDMVAHLLQLRLAMYEIYSNILEHGHPAKVDAQVEVHLHFSPGKIEGWIQDDCEPFDTLSAAVTAIPDKMAQRHRRGYGITMIRQLLDSVEYQFNDKGNRITFKKRISR